MSYDYSSESQRLELPNPYRVQNKLLWFCATLLVAAGVCSLWWAKEAVQAQSVHLAGAPLLAGLIILCVGLTCAATAAQRLRFFFGRSRPQSLASELPPGTHGSSPEALKIKDYLRQGALTFGEPEGAIQGVLYHAVPNLITAPQTLQILAKRHVFNLAAFLATGLSFMFSWWVFGTPQTRIWIGVLYFIFGSVVLLRPLWSNTRAGLNLFSLVGLIASAILAPVVVGLAVPLLPNWGTAFSLNTQTFVMLVTSLAACILSIMAVLGQLAQQTPSTHTSMNQQRVSMNAPPSMMLDELDRILQSEWTERIPNRRYARTEPLTSATTPSASFNGELFEESQPLPLTGTVAPSFASALGSRHHRALVLLDVYATGLLITSAAFTLYFVQQFDPLAGWGQGCFSFLGNSLILSVVAGFCFKEASRLWGRFDFESVLTWVELTGNYQTSRIGTGNQFTSRLNTQNDIVRTESMTLRVWRARIESVVFGKDAARQITAMFSSDQEAQRLSQRLISFAHAQSVLIATGSPEDQSRLQALQLGEQTLLADAAGAAGATPLGQNMPAALLDAARQAPATFCTACGHRGSPEARFCARCGQSLA